MRRGRRRAADQDPRARRRDRRGRRRADERATGLFAATALSFANGREVVAERPVWAPAPRSSSRRRASATTPLAPAASWPGSRSPSATRSTSPTSSTSSIRSTRCCACRRAGRPPGPPRPVRRAAPRPRRGGDVAAATGGLRDAGLVVKDAALEPITGAARPTFPAPSPANRRAFAAARAAFAARELDVAVVGGALGPAADSLNEQIVQGLLVEQPPHDPHRRRARRLRPRVLPRRRRRGPGDRGAAADAQPRRRRRRGGAATACSRWATAPA